MSKMEERIVENAVIESAELRIERGSFLVLALHLKYAKSGGQSFCDTVLFNSSKKHDSGLGNFAGRFISDVFDIVGVENLNKMAGKTIRADHSWGRIYGIGHIIEDKWFYPERLVAEIKGGYGVNQEDKRHIREV